jgi:hypothetical protein
LFLRSAFLKIGRMIISALEEDHTTGSIVIADVRVRFRIRGSFQRILRTMLGNPSLSLLIRQEVIGIIR